MHYAQVLTMAKRLSTPVTGLGVLVNFCRKASLKLCAGSVEIMSTFLLTDASCTAKLHGRCTSKDDGVPSIQSSCLDYVELMMQHAR